MGKNKLSSGLINVVTYDTDSNISLNSGSNLLMSLSGSGTVTIPGNLVVLGGISGSTAESASYSLNADKIDNLDSTQLVLTSSFNSYTSSASSSLGSLSGSVATTTSNLSSSIGDLSGSVATTTSNLSSSIATTTSGLGGRITTIEGNYATTGSNIFVGSQVITGSLYITNDMVVQGCSCLQNITASAVSIGTNTVVLNTATPAVRFAGISVQDSGSNAGVTGSIFWDGLCNKWVYSNPSGIGYSGGMLLSGPRTSTLGSESPLTCNYIAKSGGGDHLYDSCIIDDGTTVCVNANLKGSGTACFGGTICTTEVGFTSNVNSSISEEYGIRLNLGGATSQYGAQFYNCGGTKVAQISATGVACLLGLQVYSTNSDPNMEFYRTTCGAGVGIGRLYWNGNDNVGTKTLYSYIQGVIEACGTTSYCSRFEVYTACNGALSRNFQLNGVGVACFANSVCTPRLEVLRSSANNGLFVYSNSGATAIGCTMAQINGLTNDSTGNILTLASLNDGIRTVFRNDGYIGIGIANPEYRVHISTTTKGIGTNEAGVVISSNESLAANIGGTLGFGATSDYGIVTLAKVGGYRENATGTSVSSYLAFETRAGGNAVTEKMRITSDGYVAITGNQGLKCVPYLQGMSFGWNRTNGQGESMINWTNAGGGTSCDLTFNFRDSSTLYERLRISSTGVATFSGKIVANAINGSIEIGGSGYLLNPPGMTIGKYVSDMGYIQAPSGGRVEIWNGATENVVTFNNNKSSHFFGNVGIRVAPSSAGDQYLTTGDAGISYSNSYFGTGQVRIGGGSDHVSNTVFSVAPGVVTFDRPGVGGGALKIDGGGNVSINNTTATAKFHAYGTTKLENYAYYGYAQSFVWQSVFNNPVQSLFTFNAGNAYSQTLIKVTMIQNGVSNGFTGRWSGFALAHLNPYSFNSSVTTMTAEHNPSNIAAPVLSWSGQTLQITPNRATNYDGYVAFIEWGSNTNTNTLPTVTM